MCFPHAGGGVAPYLRLVRDAVPACAGVRLPGRPPRSHEPPVRRLVDAAAAVAAAVTAVPRQGLVLWGHSFGAVLAYETAVALARRDTAPALLIVSARDCPGREREHRHGWSDGDLLALLRAYGGTPEEVLADPGMRELVVAQFRVDLALLAAHDPSPHQSLTVPVLVLGGRDDPSTTAEGLVAWAQNTTNHCEAREFEGGHFFPWEDSGFLATMVDAVGGAVGDGGLPPPHPPDGDLRRVRAGHGHDRVGAGERDPAQRPGAGDEVDHSP